MEDVKKDFYLYCSFCNSTLFAMPYEGYKPYHGSYIVCANCGRENDFTSLINVINVRISKEITNITEDFKKEITKKFQKSFKNINLKIKL